MQENPSIQSETITNLSGEPNLNQEQGGSFVGDSSEVANVSQNNKKFFLGIGIFFSIILLMIVSFFVYGRNLLKESSITPNNEQIMATPEPDYKEVSLVLHNLSIMIPTEWSVTEVNKRPANLDHEECVDYLISDQAKNIALRIEPTCGFTDGGPDIWPENARIVSTINDETYLIRHQIPDGTYQYGKGYENAES